MPSVLPCSSTPSQRVRFHAPALRSAFGLRDVAGLREQQRDRCARRPTARSTAARSRPSRRGAWPPRRRRCRGRSRPGRRPPRSRPASSTSAVDLRRAADHQRRRRRRRRRAARRATARVRTSTSSPRHAHRVEPAGRRAARLTSTREPSPKSRVAVAWSPTPRLDASESHDSAGRRGAASPASCDRLVTQRRRRRSAPVAVEALHVEQRRAVSSTYTVPTRGDVERAARRCRSSGSASSREEPQGLLVRLLRRLVAALHRTPRRARRLGRWHRRPSRRPDDALAASARSLARTSVVRGSRTTALRLVAAASARAHAFGAVGRAGESSRQRHRHERSDDGRVPG